MPLSFLTLTIVCYVSSNIHSKLTVWSLLPCQDYYCGMPELHGLNRCLFCELTGAMQVRFKAGIGAVVKHATPEEEDTLWELSNNG